MIKKNLCKATILTLFGFGISISSVFATTPCADQISGFHLVDPIPGDAANFSINTSYLYSATAPIINGNQYAFISFQCSDDGVMSGWSAYPDFFHIRNDVTVVPIYDDGFGGIVADLTVGTAPIAGSYITNMTFLSPSVRDIISNYEKQKFLKKAD